MGHRRLGKPLGMDDLGAHVLAFDAGGQHTLAAGGASDPAGGGDHVYWTEAGTPHATTLTGHPTGTAGTG